MLIMGSTHRSRGNKGYFMTATERHDLRLTIWFDMLTRRQRKLISNKGYFYLSLEDMSWEDIIKVTRSAKTLTAFRDLKRSVMRVVA